MKFLIEGEVVKNINNLFYPKWLQLLLLIILSIFTSYYMLGDNLRAQWWIIDDHEIMRYLGEDGHLDFKDIPSKLLTETEVGNFGGSPRYRPSYYFLRLLETALWGNYPKLFYLTWFLILSFFFMVCWLITKETIGFIGGYFFTAATMSFTYWIDIFSRLGSSETYAVLGISLFCLGFYRYLKEKSFNTSFLTWSCIFWGAIISIGSKENLILLVIPVVWLLWDSFKKKRLTLIKLIICISIISFSAFIALSILLSISARGGQDVYSNNVSGSSIAPILT